ncbi:MAG TPA: hypothetical protein VMB72_00100 [Acidimicrobiales bacterium]|nr:hypothetical protein [Acidimicrobiales bacterium]
MDDLTQADDPLGVAEDAVVPLRVVAALVRGVETQLGAMRDELDDLEAQAEAAEGRLRAHLAGGLGDEGLEGDVLARVASWLGHGLGERPQAPAVAEIHPAVASAPPTAGPTPGADAGLRHRSEAPRPRTTVVRPVVPAPPPLAVVLPLPDPGSGSHDAGPGGLLARIPGSVLVRLGVIVVVAALLLLKLG